MARRASARRAAQAHRDPDRIKVKENTSLPSLPISSDDVVWPDRNKKKIGLILICCRAL